MQISLFKNKEKKLIEQFRSTQRAKVIEYLQRNFSISYEDSEDIYQKAFISLYNSINDGKLDIINYSISSYLLETCVIMQLNSDQIKEKALAYIQTNFTISLEDSEDIYQNSIITFSHNFRSGKLDNLTSSISTYFIGICKNKAKEFLRSKNKVVNLSYDPGIKEQNTFLDDKVESILMLESDNDIARRKKEEIVRDVVRDLPSPCNELLWGFYRDGLSMKQLAEKFNYKSESSVKVTKHRCCEKFRERFNKLVKH